MGRTTDSSRPHIQALHDDAFPGEHFYTVKMARRMISKALQDLRLTNVSGVPSNCAPPHSDSSYWQPLCFLVGFSSVCFGIPSFFLLQDRAPSACKILPHLSRVLFIFIYLAPTQPRLHILQEAPPGMADHTLLGQRLLSSVGRIVAVRIHKSL